MVLENATLAGGCFWCVEAVLERLPGILDAVSGYTGGHVHNPTYEEVCSGSTGHAEAVRVTFDPTVLPYETLLDWFWRLHDPTTLNRQGNDTGTQYRSAIFYHSENQRIAAKASRARAEASGLYRDPIVTEIVPASAFFPAEDYHQDFFRLHPSQPYCRLVIPPKLAKLRLSE